jgi:hypothetical protein
MGVLFPKQYYYLRRTESGYTDGRENPPSVSAPIPLMANIHPASSSDYQRLEANPEGRRFSGVLRCYTDIDVDIKVAGEQKGYPGDIVIYNDKRYLAIAVSKYDSLDDVDTSHARYLLTPEIENSNGEVI